MQGAELPFPMCSSKLVGLSPPCTPTWCQQGPMGAELTPVHIRAMRWSQSVTPLVRLAQRNAELSPHHSTKKLCKLALLFCQSGVSWALQEAGCTRPPIPHAHLTRGLAPDYIGPRVSWHNMSRIQLKTTHHTKNQENHNLNKKNQSIDTDTEMNQMFILLKFWQEFLSSHPKNVAIRNYEFS